VGVRRCSPSLVKGLPSIDSTINHGGKPQMKWCFSKKIEFRNKEMLKGKEPSPAHIPVRPYHR